MTKSRKEMRRVVTSDGLQGFYDTTSNISINGDPHTIVQLDNGWELLVPTTMLVAREDGLSYLPLEAVDYSNNPQTLKDFRQSDREPADVVIPVIAEELDVQTRKKSARIRFIKRIHQREQVVDAQGFTEDVQVEHVAVNRPVDQPPQVRYEGDVMIIPVLEEVAVVERKLILKEELHVRKQRREISNTQQVTLRTEQVDVERIPEDILTQRQNDSSHS
jgi:stress response protein YsnF